MTLRRVSLAGRALILTVRMYQATLSPFIGRQCRFQPTCSHYFIEAVTTHGAFRGGLMGLWRIIRCNPFSKGGYDPVPLGKLETRISKTETNPNVE